MSRTHRVNAIVLNYNQADAACQSFDELHRSRDVAIDVLVVDAASEPADVAVLREHVPPERLLLLPENRGYAGGMNAGMQYWEEHDPGTPVLLVTPDARVGADVAAALLQGLEDERTAALGPVVVYREGPQRRVGAGGSIDPRRRKVSLVTNTQICESGDVDWIEGCCMLLRPRAVREVGGFDDEYFLYFEEIDLCHRLRLAGWRVRVMPTVSVQHPKAPGQSPPHYYYYMTRNAYRFWSKNFDVGTPATALATVRMTLWLAALAVGATLLPTRWHETRQRWRDCRRQFAGAWAGTRDHLKGTYGPRVVSTPRPG